MISEGKEGIGLFVMMVDNDGSNNSSKSTTSLPSLLSNEGSIDNNDSMSLKHNDSLDKDKSSDNENNNGSMPALVPRINNNDEPILPALVAHAKDSDEVSWGSHLKKTLTTVTFCLEMSYMIMTTTWTTTLGIQKDPTTLTSLLNTQWKI